MAPEIFFNLFVVTAFFAAMADHWFVGRGYIVVPLRAFMLGCFVYTESYLAWHNQPAMWLYVALNIWGLTNLYLGRRAPLRSGRETASSPTSTATNSPLSRKCTERLWRGSDGKGPRS